MPRLLEVADLCSRTVSDTANRVLKRTDSEGSSSVAEKKSSAVPLFRSGHMSAICARLGSKGKVGVQRGRETAGVPSFLPPRRVPRRSPPPRARQSPALRRAQLPAESQRKKNRPSGANTPAAVRVPRSAGAEKRLPPVRDESPRCGSAPQNKNTADPQSAVFCFIPFRQGRKTRQAARYCPRYTQSHASTPCRCRSAPSA